MGAVTFYNTAHGTSPDAAFRAAVEEARDEYGHRFDSGTIGVKEHFVLIDARVRAYDDAQALAGRLIDEDTRIADRDGPAGCLEYVPDPPQALRAFLFFGRAQH